MTGIIHLHHGQLARHPRNMHLTYPLREVRQMAVSQADRARRGLDPCIQPLIVTPGPGVKYNLHLRQPLIIVAGNRRHAGNAWLGDKAPPLNCIVRYYPDEESMRADMRIENGQRTEPSPLGWARNFQESVEAGVKLPRLVRESGKRLHFVRSMLQLLTLAPRVQALVDAGDLPLGAIKHLHRLQDPNLQSKIAESAARHGAGERGLALAVERALRAQQPRRKAPVPAQPKRPPATATAPDDLPATLADLRAGAALTCGGCTAPGKLKILEPAWHIALQAAGQTCDTCSVLGDKGACDACALPEMLSRVTRRLSGANGHGS